MRSRKDKIGRNDPCLCGSGRKYKKCCLGKKMDFPFLKDIADRFRRPKVIPTNIGGLLLGRPFIDEVMGNFRFRAVGNRIYKRPITETFHEFLWFHFLQFFDKGWLDCQYDKPPQEQHLLMQWILEGRKVMDEKKEYDSNNQAYTVPLTGNTKNLLSLEYDLYTLAHCKGNILPKLLGRLKTIDQFQGARYEVAVASIAVRAGFEIEWLNSQDKHCEFIGTSILTGEKVAFEAKSHHRPGVLGREGTLDTNKARLKVVDHIKEALEQNNQDLPMVIFDDLNLPTTPEKSYKEKEWFKLIDESLKEAGFFDGKTTKKYACLFITNFSWHYHREVGNKENEIVSYWFSGGSDSLRPETISHLDRASRQYGAVPNKISERAVITQKDDVAFK